MAKKLILKRGSDDKHNDYTGDLAEVTFNTDTNKIHVHDGENAGGKSLAFSSDLDPLKTDIGSNSDSINTLNDNVSSNSDEITNIKEFDKLCPNGESSLISDDGTTVKVNGTNITNIKSTIWNKDVSSIFVENDTSYYVKIATDIDLIKVVVSSGLATTEIITSKVSDDRYSIRIQGTGVNNNIIAVMDDDKALWVKTNRIYDKIQIMCDVITTGNILSNQEMLDSRTDSVSGVNAEYGKEILFDSDLNIVSTVHENVIGGLSFGNDIFDTYKIGTWEPKLYLEGSEQDSSRIDNVDDDIPATFMKIGRMLKIQAYLSVNLQGLDDDKYVQISIPEEIFGYGTFQSSESEVFTDADGNENIITGGMVNENKLYLYKMYGSESRLLASDADESITFIIDGTFISKE